MVSVKKLKKLKRLCLKKKKVFRAGKLKNHIKYWKKITHNKKIIKYIEGVNILEINDNVNTSQVTNLSKNYNLSVSDKVSITKELKVMLEQGIIKETIREVNDIVSKIFPRTKSDGVSIRIILNLKQLNEQLPVSKFKMSGILDALDLVTPNAFMASIDLIQAYFNVSVNPDQVKYLKFFWNGKYYNFQVLPNGYCRAPLMFTLITKPIMAYLHRLGHMCTFYIDDSFLISENKEDCIQNVLDTVNILHKLGFSVHPEKSVFIPTTRIEYLGFIIDSVDMTIELNMKRKTKILTACKLIKNKDKFTIRMLASLIGLLVSAMVAVPVGKLFYRNLEKVKIRALKEHKGNWEKEITNSCLNKEALSEIEWWEVNTMDYKSPIHRENPLITITSDACKTGFGAVCNEIEFNGHWNVHEKVYILIS